MSEQPEDSKPKLNLVISHSGTRTSCPLSPLMRVSSEDDRVCAHPCLVHAEVTVKVKANMQFKKIFEVAEVCCSALSA
jgi:hypothetical protein